MTAREAKFNDYWRTAFKREYPTFLSAVKCTGAKLFDGMELKLNAGINVIVGRNGIGKSNLIRHLYNAFYNLEGNRVKFSTPLLEDGKLELTLTKKSGDTKIEIEQGECIDEDYGITGFMYDPCSLIPSIQNFFVTQAHIEELIAANGSVDVIGDDLKLINYLTNRVYQRVEVTNIEEGYEEFNIIPFFTVEVDGAQYDSRNMGLGELSLFYFCWLFTYMSKASNEKFLLVEEPESFLPPSTQEKLSNVFAMIASVQGIPLFVSTHSEHILKRVPRTHVQVMKRSISGVRCFNASDSNEPLKLLGLQAPKIGVLLFEDVVAGIFIRALLRPSLKFVTDSFYYHNSTSDGDILEDLKRFPSRLECFNFIGVFDGDCRGRIEKNVAKGAKYCFLPQNKAPEELLIDLVVNYDADELAKKLQISNVDLLGAIDSAAGSNHHDYFYIFSRAIDKDYNVIVTKICDIWVEDNANSCGNDFLPSLEAVCS